MIPILYHINLLYPYTIMLLSLNVMFHILSVYRGDLIVLFYCFKHIKRSCKWELVLFMQQTLIGLWFQSSKQEICNKCNWELWVRVKTGAFYTTSVWRGKDSGMQQSSKQLKQLLTQKVTKEWGIFTQFFKSFQDHFACTQWVLITVCPSAATEIQKLLHTFSENSHALLSFIIVVKRLRTVSQHEFIKIWKCL